MESLIKHPYTQSVFSNIKKEWNMLRRPVIFLTVVATGLVQFLHNASHNYVKYLAAKYNVYGGKEGALVDLGFKATDQITTDLSWFPNNTLFMSAGFAIVIGLSVSFTDLFIESRTLRSMQMLWRACIVCCISVFLRVCSFMMTLLPSPAPHCSKEELDPPKTVAEIFLEFDTGNGCSDLIFSSHMLYGLVATCCLSHYMIVGNPTWTNPGSTPKWKVGVRIGIVVIAWLTSLTEGFTIVDQQRHYSIDVFTALYIVPLVWVAFYHFVPNDPKEEVVVSKENYVEDQKELSCITV
jgi:hypothetical protein